MSHTVSSDYVCKNGEKMEAPVKIVVYVVEYEPAE